MTIRLRKSITTCCNALFIPILFIAIFLGISPQLHAQYFESFPAFGNFSATEIALKKVPFDEDASAVILFDLGYSTYNDDHNLITRRRVRMKILNDKGIDKANIEIPYYSRDKFEFISDVKAVVANYDENNLPAVSMLEKKAIYDTRMNDYYSEVKFALPNVKPGSIIEYEYQSTMKHYGGLDTWSFQADIPTLKSYYKLDVLPNAEFTYQVRKLESMPIKINTNTPGTVVFEMQKIPGLADEPYMDARKDNLQHVILQLSAYNNYGFKSKYLNSWDDVAKDLLSSDGLGGQLKKQLSGTDEFIKATKTLASETERLNAVYKFVQQKISWDGFTATHTNNGIKSAWDKGSGTTAEVNLAFINLLNRVDVDAVPLLASDRQHKKVDRSFPFIDQFNKLVAYVYIGDKKLIIDASDKSTPIQLLPFSLLNTYAYVLDKKRKGILFLEDPKLYFDNQVFLNAQLHQDGVMEGSATVYSKDYARLERNRYYTKNAPEKFIEKYFTSSYSNLKADSLELSQLDKDSMPLKQNVVFKQTLNTSGDYAFINYHLFTGLTVNPFKASNRFSDVNLGSPQRYTVTENIQLPENYTVDALPKNVSMSTPDNSLSLKRSFTVTDNRIVAQLRLEIKQSYFEKEIYTALKDFYKKMFDYLDEQIVLKRKS